MAEIPKHPEVEATRIDGGAPGRRRVRAGPFVIGAIVVAVLIAVIVLHLSGALRPPTH